VCHSGWYIGPWVRQCQVGGVRPSVLQFVTDEVKQIVPSWLNELNADLFWNRFIELTAGWLSS
jgi:hypothetical protein